MSAFNAHIRLIWVSFFMIITICIPSNIAAQGCDFLEDESIYRNIAGQNTNTSFTQVYALTQNQLILEIANIPTFPAQSAGSYAIYAINYETASGISGFANGNNITAITGSCLDTTSTIVNVCICATDCHSTDGTIAVDHTNFNAAPNYTQSYALTNTAGLILEINNNPASLSPLFSGLAIGNYRLYALNYETAAGITNYAVGNNITNVNGTCLDREGPFCYNICQDPTSNYTGCNSTDGTVKVNSIGFNKAAGFVQSYALADTNGVIQRITDNTTDTKFIAVPAGKYQVYALNYETAAGISNYAIGNNISTVSGGCIDQKGPIYYQVCPCPFTDCNSTDGVVSITNTGYNTTVDFTQSYVLTDTFGLILERVDAPQNTDSLFTGIATGFYHLYGINFETTSGINGLTVGNNIANITGTCFDIAGAFCYQVCNNNYDWGDLPDSSDTTTINDYQTLLANNGPRHQIISGLSLGDTVDIESDGQPDNQALGDGIDEDGLIIFPSLNLTPGVTFRIPFSYTNTTTETAHLEAWMDWNGDGDFDDLNELIVDWDDAITPFSNRLEISIPSNAVTGVAVGLRIRISLQDNMTPYGAQPNGEVEDYLIAIDCPQVCLPISATVKRGN